MLQTLTPTVIISIITGYFLVLMVISYFTSKDGNSNESFFLAGRKSPWFLVAFGMIGASLSGVTFISVPGWVGEINTTTGKTQGFAYMQMVMGYLLGYAVIATVLLPLYYRLGLTSIYEFLEQRFGRYSYKIGAFYFLISRIIGASFRLYLVAIVLQEFVMNAFGIPFPVTVLTTILLIWVYTFRGGIKTIVYTDTLQTLSMLMAVILTILGIGQALETDISGLAEMVSNSNYSQVFFFEGGWSDPYNFWKQFLAGALITIVMTGLDQDMMQKNLSCKSLGDAQKNMFTFSIVLFFANILFLSLGALLYIYAMQVGIDIPASTDKLYPMIALQHLSPYIGILFIIGLIAAAYSSADSALTALTTSFCVDFLGFGKKTEEEDIQNAQKRKRFLVHIGFSVVLLIVILIFNALNNDAVIKQLFTAAGYTYGPLLGLFTFGMTTNLKIREVLDLKSFSWGGKLPPFLQKVNLVILVCLLAPCLSFVIDSYSADLLYGFEFGFLIIALNGFLTFLGLLAISYHDYEDQLDKHEPYQE
ncbi:MAG: sodium:solute symporter [Lewinella sp.]|uniref:sodium:solute symporter n=1 Tax=Lewinella sp. TaxID=2004506 RepID=UPI003D6C1A33